MPTSTADDDSRSVMPVPVAGSGVADEVTGAVVEVTALPGADGVVDWNGSDPVVVDDPDRVV
jgi:hypothetical protein